MSFLSNILNATVKVALLPVAIAKDVVNVATGETPEATANMVSSAIEDAKSGITQAIEGDVV